MEYRALSIERKEGVATVRIRPLRISFSLEPYAEVHEEMGHALSMLRVDDAVRVVVLTGEEDGEFMVPPPSKSYNKEGQHSRLGDPRAEWGRFTGVIRAHQAIAEMEKPVISKVNGDAMGFGQSLMFNSDFIIARDDAVVCDMHMSLGEATTSQTGEKVGPGYSNVPGDGAMSFVPFFMSPVKAKEYMLLGRPIGTAELARLGMINSAVPLAQLDTEVDEYVQQLLRRAADVLAFTKRTLNRRIAQHMNMTLDMALAYQLFNFRQHTDK
ncbi:enoyl-CoA hydratase/isomerase family protein [Achromobacter aloeverae]